MEPPAQIFPYDLHPSGNSSFVAIESPNELLALPLSSLASVHVRRCGGEQRLTLVFDSITVIVEGRGLDEAIEQLLNYRVKSIRVGSHAECEIAKIHVNSVLVRRA